MKILLLKICLFFAMMPPGYQHQERKAIVVGKNKHIVVTGKAGRAMEGTVVLVGRDHVPYYLDGIHDWDKKFYGKKVIVSGTLVVKHNPYADSPGRQVQAILVKRIIKNPKWKLGGRR